MRSQYHHGDLKTAILDAAEEALSEKSLDALSMRELARRAGVSSGAPYHHFGDRTGLIVALCQRGFSRLGLKLQNANKKNGLKAMTKEYLSFAQDHPALYQLMFSNEATMGDGAELLTPYGAPLFDLLEEVILKETGSGNRRKANLAAISVWCFMHGAANLSVAPPLQARLGSLALTRFAYDSVMQIVAEESR